MAAGCILASNRESKMEIPVKGIRMSIEDSYNRLAPDYDLLRFGDKPGRYDFEETEVLIKNIITTRLQGCCHHWLALDVACGTGKIAVTVGKLDERIVAVDVAPNMLRQCLARSRAAGVEDKVMLTNGRAEVLPFRTGSFDICFSFRFLHLLPRAAYPGVVRDMARVVRPGGHIVIEVKNRWYGGAVFWVKDLIRSINGESTFSSYMDIRQLRSLAEEVDEVSLESVTGLLLPSGWRLMEYPYLRRIAQVQAKRQFKRFAANLVAIYRKG